MRKVLMGDFDAMYRLGFRVSLRRGTVEWIEAGRSGVLDELVEALPDVVVLDEDQESTAVLVARIVEDFPAIKVIACSSENPTMRIFPAFHRGEFYTRALEPTLFEREVNG